MTSFLGFRYHNDMWFNSTCYHLPRVTFTARPAICAWGRDLLLAVLSRGAGVEKIEKKRREFGLNTL